MAGKPWTNPLTCLHRFIAKRYDLEELRTLSLDLSLQFDDLRGEGRSAKARELILACGRRGVLENLLAQLRSDRPQEFHSAGLSLDPAALEALRVALPSFEDASLPESPVPGESPFKGLQHFDQADAHLFFGREKLTADLANKLREHQFLAVVGNSGSGKSSVVRAGLIPALKGDRPLADRTRPPDGSADWPVHVITPTVHPLEALAASLTRDSESVTATATLMDDLARDPRSLHLYVRKLLSHSPDTRTGGDGYGERLLLVVDQFEELFTLCQDKAERKAFVDNLMSAVAPGGRTVLLVVVRADFYEHCGQYTDLRNAISQHQVYIGRMEQEELRRAIEEPATRNNWQFEAGLVDLILRDVGEEPGRLPLLSHALLETWKRRQGRTLTLEGYEDASGVHGAIAKTAEWVYLEELTPERQAIARSIFLRLTRPGEGTEDTKRRATLRELMPAEGRDPEAVEATVLALANARLITTEGGEEQRGQQCVQVAHEALIRGWSRLRKWIEEDREALRVHHRLTEVANEWGENHRDDGFLYRGARLAAAEEWAVAHAADLNSLERDFLGASVMLRDLQAQEAEQQRQNELEQQQRLFEEQRARAEEKSQAAEKLRRRATYLRIALAVAVAAAAIAAILFVRAQAATRAEAAARVIAVTREAEAKEQESIAVSRQLAAQSARALDSSNYELALLLAIEAGYVADTAEAFDALWQASAYPARTLLSLSGHKAWTNEATWNSDGSHILTAGCDREERSSGCMQGTARIWDAQTGEELIVLAGHTDGVWALWNSDESLVLTRSADGTARVWDARTGDGLAVLVGHRWRVRQAKWNDDETRILTSSDDGTVRVWDAKTGKPLAILAGHSDWVTQADWNADEMRILTASDDGTARIWDAQTGEKLHVLASHAGSVWAWWSADESLVLTRDGDGTTRVWDALTGNRLPPLPDPADGLQWIAYSADGSRILIADEYGAVRVMDARTGMELATLLVPADQITQAKWNADGTRILTSSDYGTVRVWDAQSGEELVVLSGHAGWIRQAEWNADETGILSVGRDGTIRLWRLADGRELKSLPGDVAVWSADRSRVLVGGDDGVVRVWDAQDGKELLILRGHKARICQARWNADETRILTASGDGTARMWDAETGEELAAFAGDTDWVFKGEWDPAGTRVLTISADGRVRVRTLGSEPVILTSRIAPLPQTIEDADDSRILISSRDHTVRVRDVKTGEEMLALTYGTEVVVPALESTEDTWSARMEDFLEVACERAPRNMTRNEWRQFMRGKEYRVTCSRLPTEQDE